MSSFVTATCTEAVSADQLMDIAGASNAQGVLSVFVYDSSTSTSSGPIGRATEDAASGAVFTVEMFGDVQEWMAGAAIAAGDDLMVTDNGKVLTATAGKNVIGRALTAAAADTDPVTVCTTSAGGGTDWADVTASAAELNVFAGAGVTNADAVKLHAITASAGDVNAVTDQAADAEFSVAAEGSHAIVTTVQLEDADDANLGAAINVDCWISDAAGGIGTTVDPTSNTAVGGSGAVLTETGGLTHFTKLKVTTGATGSFTVTTTQTAAHNYYLNVRLPNGVVKSSAIIAHLG